VHQKYPKGEMSPSEKRWLYYDVNILSGTETLVAADKYREKI